MLPQMLLSMLFHSIHRDLRVLVHRTLVTFSSADSLRRHLPFRFSLDEYADIYVRRKPVREKVRKSQLSQGYNFRSLKHRAETC